MLSAVSGKVKSSLGTLAAHPGSGERGMARVSGLTREEVVLEKTRHARLRRGSAAASSLLLLVILVCIFLHTRARTPSLPHAHSHTHTRTQPQMSSMGWHATTALVQAEILKKSLSWQM